MWNTQLQQPRSPGSKSLLSPFSILQVVSPCLGAYMLSYSVWSVVDQPFELEVVSNKVAGRHIWPYWQLIIDHSLMIVFTPNPRGSFAMAKFSLLNVESNKNSLFFFFFFFSFNPCQGNQILDWKKAHSTMAIQLTRKCMWPAFCLTESDLPWGQCNNKTSFTTRRVQVQLIPFVASPFLQILRS